jgi:hypothetical protein
MVSGIQFIESILFWMAMAFLFFAFVSACMESRHSDDIDQARLKISAKFEHLGAVPLHSLMVLSLRFFRDAVDRAVSEMLSDFDVSPFAAPMVMAILSILLPTAAAINALLGGSPFLISVYASIAIAIFVMGLNQSSRGTSWALGGLSLLATFGWLVFGPIYAVHSLTDHILPGTFSHAVLGSIFVAAILYAGCAGTWVFYRSLRTEKELSHVDVFVARFLFAVTLMYVLYWFGLLAGHFATNDPSPHRGWPELLVVVSLGAFSFAAILAAVEWGVREHRRGHGLAVMFAALVLSIAGAVAIHGIITHELPFWLRLWHRGFSSSDINLDASFWTSHILIIIWGIMLSGVLFISLARGVLFFFSGGPSIAVGKPFLVLSGALVGCAMVVLGASVIVDVYVNVN